MIVTIDADGVVVGEADDCSRLHVCTDLDAAALLTALHATGTGEPADDDVWLDLAVLRSRAQLVATAEDWAERWSGMVAGARGAGRVSADGRSVRARVGR